MNARLLLLVSVMLGAATHVATPWFPHSPLVQPASRQPPVLTAFALQDGRPSASAGSGVALSHAVVGTLPTAYRVSHRADFAGANWQPYERRPMFQPADSVTTAGCDVAGTARRLRLFFQVRATLGDDVRILNGQRTLVPIIVESNVLTDGICLIATAPASPNP